MFKSSGNGQMKEEAYYRIYCILFPQNIVFVYFPRQNSACKQMEHVTVMFEPKDQFTDVY